MTPAEWAGVYKPLWLAAALLNSGYSYFWDLERDWEIQAFTGPPNGVPWLPCSWKRVCLPGWVLRRTTCHELRQPRAPLNNANALTPARRGCSPRAGKPLGQGL